MPEHRRTTTTHPAPQRGPRWVEPSELPALPDVHAVHDQLAAHLEMRHALAAAASRMGVLPDEPIPYRLTDKETP